MKNEELREKLLRIAGLESADEIKAPEWDAAPISHWARYVIDDIRELWNELDDQSRLVAFIYARRQAEYDYGLDE